MARVQESVRGGENLVWAVPFAHWKDGKDGKPAKIGSRPAHFNYLCYPKFRHMMLFRRPPPVGAAVTYPFSNSAFARNIFRQNSRLLL